ncbi:MAG: hypothetical protein DI536_28975 [Archangium gephyra]|uniref:Helicase HerA central domain-containing protein n=1 Tax=Archangium gephyra TaxID=48 RepID=A0A2W5SWB2_9BACT|nr:MAG: hypothetical protein DI536_28975 [Archangium gephyra]
MKALRISEDLELPLDAITERLAFLGQSGGGKTYAAGVLAEQMLELGAQVVVLDPVGPWWGLRSSADGKKAGYPITVFGGIHGDVPLTHTAGAIVADVLVDRGVSAVLDVSDFTVGQMHQFVRDFAERFFDRKKRNPTPVHLFLEEAHTFLPERLPPDPMAATMLHRLERIVRVGRNYGIGSSQISQMPQAVTKKTLNQAALCFAFRTVGKHERKALRDWFDQHGGGELVKELPSLAKGVAYAVSPGWLQVTKAVRIAAKTTFDSSETPKFGGKPTAPKVLAPVDVEQLRAAMGSAMEEAEKDDPKALRKRIVELERQLAAKPAAPAPVERIIEKPVLGEKEVNALREVVAAHGRAAEAMQSVVTPIIEALRQVTRPGTPQDANGYNTRRPPVPRPEPRQRPAARARSDQQGGQGLGGGERAMLEALVSRHPTPLTRNQVAMLSGYAAGGGTFAKYLSTLKSGGFVVTSGDQLSATAAGVAAAGDVAPITDVVLMWRAKLGGGERRMFDELVDVYPESLERAELGERTGYESKGGTFAKYLSTLKSIGVVEVSGGKVSATADLFSA